MDFSKIKAGAYPSTRWPVGCSVVSQTARRVDCYYYSEEAMMGAHVPCCGKHPGLGNCPCSNDCEFYLSRAKAAAIINAARK